MKYLGTRPQEGLVLLANSTISGVTSVAFDNVFSSEYDMYFFEIYDFETGIDGKSLFFDFTADGSVISGTINRGGFYQYSQYDLGYIGTFNDTNAEMGNSNVGNATGEGAYHFGWLVPQTANNKILAGESAGVDVGGLIQHDIRGYALESATLCNGIDFKTDSGNMAGEFRLYGLGKRRNKLKSINQANRTTNFVESNYIGNSNKTDGQGWILVASATASDGDSAMEFQNCFSSKYDLYRIVAEDMRPSDDKKNLFFQWMVDSTAQTGTYNSAYFYQDGLGQSQSGQVGNQALAILSNGTGTDNRESSTSIFHCNPQSTNAKSLMGKGIGQMSSDESSRTRTWHSISDYATKTTPYNGIKFYWSAGNFESGTVRIYGRQS